MKYLKNFNETIKNDEINAKEPSVDLDDYKIGKVYFNDDKYPGFHYVKEILPKYQMYWIGTESNEIIPAFLEKDEDGIYWLESPDGKFFGYEIFKHAKGYLILDLFYPEEMQKYLIDGGKWFPSSSKG